MKKKLTLLLSCLVLGLAALPSSSHATVINVGSCGWQTDGSWHWSPIYGVWEMYLGHTVIYGHNYRHFYVYSPTTNAYDNWYKYCGTF